MVGDEDGTHAVEGDGAGTCGVADAGRSDGVRCAGKGGGGWGWVAGA